MKLFCRNKQLSICFILIFSSLYSQVRIIGGEEIDIEDAPWTVNMRIVNSAGVRLFNRSGIVVSDNLVLTASHNWPNYKYDHLAVHAGGANVGAGKYYKVHRVIHHPNSDLTLLELSEPLKFCGNIQPIDYETCKDESLYVPETDAVVYGWGRIVPDAASNLLILRAVDVKIISREKANRIYGASVVPDNTIVSVGKNSLGMGGKGDSGGPLVVFDEEQNPILVGVTALADTRSEAKNSGLTVYNKVKPVIEWIDNCKCEIIGIDTVSPFGTSFTIVNMPPGVKSVEWTYSGLIEINSTMDCTNVIPSEIEGEITGCVSAVITTNLGTITVCKELTIMPRIDVDINIRYNKNRSKYEMIAKTVNMKTIDNKDILKCKDVVDNVKLLGFIWTYDKEIAIGKEVIFDVDPNSSKTHTISVNRYDCDHTIRLEKTFVIHHKNNEFAIVHNEPGTITIGGMRMSIDIDTFEELQMTYIKNTVENNVLLNTSHITMENLNSFEKKLDKGNYKVSLYSRKGNLLYVNYFTNNTLPLQINTSEFYSDIYILHIHNLDTNNVMTRFLVVNQ